MNEETPVCFMCREPLPDPKATYGDYGYPQCWDCFWWSLDNHSVFSYAERHCRARLLLAELEVGGRGRL